MESDLGFGFNGYTDENGIPNNWHNAIILDLSDLIHDGDTFTAHFTMQCGNDNLMGRNDPNGPPVPIPGAVWLFGSGLLGLVGIRRRRDG